ncbi:hypothetical protein AB0C96_31655 [Streptomyces sp. NPDC048506]|uniref:hypothetical protein n=1 Tax=Streptomyces sp. NPDC048506 TaxID=3155028 RepID=UPI003433389F
MTDLILRALLWVLCLLLPARGRHSMLHPAAPSVPESEPNPVNPWNKPWAGPSAKQVRAIFRDEETLRLSPVQRERRWAAEFAALGVDYAYRYPGDQFAAVAQRAERPASPVASMLIEYLDDEEMIGIRPWPPQWRAAA